MDCITCMDPVVETVWGPWCDKCGGVRAPTGLLIFRHVATAYGDGGRHPIVFDASTESYAVVMPHLRNPHAGEMDSFGEFRKSPLVMAHGTIDAMIALVQPLARGDGHHLPSLAPAPSATKEERVVVRL